MSAPNSYLGPALVLSLALHAALIVVAVPWRSRDAGREPARAPLAALLVKPAAQPPLFLPEPPKPAAAQSETEPSQAQKVPERRGPQPRPRAAARQAARAASEQVGRSLLYPPEAIARGLEGEALVLLFLDEAGNALAARIERSSGHVLLDEAAVRAAKTVRSLPEAAPREVLLPVRFRLQ